MYKQPFIAFGGLTFALISVGIFLSSLHSREVSPQMKNISRFEDDRIAFHSIHYLDSEGSRIPGTSPELDPSLATLVIIKNSQTYIFQDGNDSKREVMDRINDYQRSIGKFRTRRAFIKEYRDALEEKNKWEAQPEEFRRGKDISESRFHSVFQKYDSIYKKIELDHKKAQAEEYRQRRFAGKDSPGHKKSLEDLENYKGELQERSNFLKETLNKEMNASDSPEASPEVTNDSNTKRALTPLENIVDPGEWSEKNFYTNHIDGNIDSISYSRSARTIDWEKKDTGESKSVQEKYGALYDEMVASLLKAHREKFLYNYNRKAETGSRVAIEENPQGKGKRYIMITGDRLRYVLEDWDGDGKVETWEVSNPSLPFKYSSEAANIISITNCKIEKICSHFSDLITEIETGTSTTLGEIKRYGGGADSILGNEDELLRDWDSRIREIK
ncbi:MAG: hypothetical protein JJT78_01270 [Leptospira sp.]|nr:hypothetical protein [Leptospira sp.]